MLAPDVPEASVQRTLTRNIAVLLSSQTVTWLISLIGVWMITRLLGAGLIGQYHLASSIWAVGMVVIGFGMSMTITKAVARRPERAVGLLATGMVARLLIAVPVAAAVFGYARLAGYPTITFVLLAILGLSSLLSIEADVISAGLQGLDRMGSLSIATVTARLVSIGGAIALLYLGYGVYAVAGTAAAGSAVAVILQFWFFRRIRRELDLASDVRVLRMSEIKDLLVESLPYFWIALSIVVYQQLDIILISLLTDNDDVMGWYSAYERLAGTFMFVPTVFMTAIFPTLSRLFDPEHDGMAPGSDRSGLVQKSVQIMLLASVPVGFGAASVARPLVELIFGSDFSNAGPVVAVGGFVLSLTYLTTILGTFLIAMDKQRQWTWFIVLGGILTIPLDLILVPIFEQRYGNGAIGAVLGFLITESVVLTGAIRLLPAGSLNRTVVWFAARVIAAGAVMALTVVLLDGYTLGLRVAAGAAVYLVMVGILRLVSREDRAAVGAWLEDLRYRRGRSIE